MTRLSRSDRAIAAATALVVIVAMGAALALILGDASIDAAAIAERLRAEREWSAAAVIGLMVLHCFVPFPAEFLALAAGAVFGPVLGTLWIWIGAMLGASLSFGLSRRLGRPATELFVPARHRAALDRWADDQGALALLVSRMIPVIAFNLVNYAAGLTKVSWWTFLWTTGVGILPLTALVVWMGSAMRSISWPWLLAISAAGIVAIALCHRRLTGHGGKDDEP